MSTPLHILRSRLAALKRHSLFLFFARLTFILVLLAGIGMGSTYYYFRQESMAQVDRLVNEGLSEIEQSFRAEMFDDPQKRQEVLAHVQTLIEESRLLRVEIVDSHDTVILKHHKMPLPEAAERVFDNLPAWVDEPVSALLPLDESSFVLLYAKTMRWHGETFETRIALPLHADTARMLHERTSTILWSILATLLLVVVAIFPIILAQYRQLNHDRIELLLSHMGTIIALGNAISKRDSDTHEHNYRVTYYSLKLAEAMDLEPEHFPALIKGAFLHDVGKIGIPDAILLKPGRLDDEEFAEMKKHVRLGLEIVKDVLWLEDATEVIGYHHEKFDGSGYPRGTRGEAIPLSARIFAVADVFDALSSRRPYKDPIAPDRCLEMLEEEAGRHFDPMAVHVFVEIAPALWEQAHEQKEVELKILLFEAIRPYIGVLMGRKRLS